MLEKKGEVTPLHTKTIRIVVADDHAMVREGLVALLEKESDLKVVGQAAHGRQAVEVVLHTNPEVVLIDMHMPQLNGVEATRQMLSQDPDLKILMLSAFSDHRMVTRALKAGAAGYLLKKSSFGEVVTAIRTVIDTGTYLSPKVTGAVVEHLARSEEGVRPFLTAREREVVQLLSEGFSTKEVAAKLFVSVKTVESHRLRVMRKLGYTSLAQLTKYAIREGITSLEC